MGGALGFFMTPVQRRKGSIKKNPVYDTPMAEDKYEGLCNACAIERMGCGCDGALDDGCFLCSPDVHQRPPCPTDCKSYRPTAWEHINATSNE
jgi:hypothetical protein